jgi:DNA-binding transcriptional LysR family regulator
MSRKTLVETQSPGPTLRQLDVFQCTLQLGSASAAARALHISQPAVTQILQQMEAACGMRLFERRRGRLLPTPEAQSLHFEIDKVHRGLDVVRRQIEALRRYGMAQLRIGCLHALSIGLVPRVLAHFRQQHPRTRIALMVEGSLAIRDAVAAGSLDVGIVADEANTDGLSCSALYEIGAACLLPTAHPLSRKDSVQATDLAGVPLICLSSTDRAQMRLCAAFAEAGVEPDVVIETPFSATQCALVAAGAGIAVVNPLVAAEYQCAGLTLLPFVPRLPFRAMLVTHPGRPMAAPVRELISALRKELSRSSTAEYRALNPQTRV